MRKLLVLTFAITAVAGLSGCVHHSVEYRSSPHIIPHDTLVIKSTPYYRHTHVEKTIIVPRTPHYKVVPKHVHKKYDHYPYDNRHRQDLRHVHRHGQQHKPYYPQPKKHRPRTVIQHHVKEHRVLEKKVIKHKPQKTLIRKKVIREKHIMAHPSKSQKNQPHSRFMDAVKELKNSNNNPHKASDKALHKHPKNRTYRTQKEEHKKRLMRNIKAQQYRGPKTELVAHKTVKRVVRREDKKRLKNVNKNKKAESERRRQKPNYFNKPTH